MQAVRARDPGFEIVFEGLELEVSRTRECLSTSDWVLGGGGGV